MKSYIFAIVVFVSILLLNCFVYAQYKNLESLESEPEREAAKERYDLIKRISKNSDSSIEFYGVVKDQHGDPVSGAKVLAHYNHFDLLSPYFEKSSNASVNTDSKGFFVFKDLKGRSLFIETIDKEGYVFDSRKNANRVFSYDAMRSNPFTPDKNNPIVFILHKKPEPGFVIEKTDSYIAKAAGGILQVDVCNGFSQSLQQINKPWGDMRIEIRPTAKEGDHTVKITLNNQDDWLLAQDLGKEQGEDYVAPDSGYSKSIEYTIKQREDFVRDIYYKGKKGTETIHSRLHLKLRAGNNSVHFDGRLYTNRDGGKNLNYDRKYTLKRQIQDVSAKIDKESGNAKLYQERSELKRDLSLYDDALSDIDKALELTPEDKRLQRLKERTQINKKRHAELKAQGFKFHD